MTKRDHYADYAAFYDEGSITSVSKKVALLQDTIERLNPGSNTILEVACGTGNILEPLSKDYEVTGLDLSPKMLEIARTKLPNTDLHTGDMTDFHLNKKFDVILCIYDSVNHLLEFEEWEKFLDRVKEHLAPGGLFIVDINTIAKLENFSKHPIFVEVMDDNYQLGKVEKRDDGLYYWNLDIFAHEAGDIYKLSRSSIPTAAFSIERIQQSLANRFTGIELFTPDDTPADESANRIYFACKATQ